MAKFVETTFEPIVLIDKYPTDGSEWQKATLEITVDAAGKGTWKITMANDEGPGYSKAVSLRLYIDNTFILDNYYSYSDYSNSFPCRHNTTKSGTFTISEDCEKFLVDFGVCCKQAAVSSDPNTASRQTDGTMTRYGERISDTEWGVYLTRTKATTTLTVNLYSNYATSGELENKPIEGVSESSNIKVYTHVFEKDVAYLTGLCDVQNSDWLYLSRTGYEPTGYWGTKQNGGILIGQYDGFTGSELADILGLNISSSDASVDLYAQWEPLYVKIYALHNGEYKLGTLYARNSQGILKPVKDLYQNNNNIFEKLK